MSEQEQPLSEQPKQVSQILENSKKSLDLGQLQQYFEQANIASTVLKDGVMDHAAKQISFGATHYDFKQVLRAVFVEIKYIRYLVITNIASLLDVVALMRWQQAECEPVEFETDKYPEFYDPLLHTCCPLPYFIKCQGIMAKQLQTELATMQDILLPVGEPGTFLCVAAAEYLKLHQELAVGDFTVSIETVYATPELELTRTNIAKRMNKVELLEKKIFGRMHETFEMPAMPNMAEKLLKLRINPAANAHDLGELVKHDPSLAAQLISWASSPYYGFTGKITSVEDAIIKVLGFDLVMNIALGLAIGQMMNISNKGRLGLARYWQHSLYVASFIEMIVNKIPASPTKPYKGLAYLAGLLHNFGHLFLGQSFPKQFNVLNQMISVNPNFSVCEVEQYLFNTNHQKIGAWLMKNWRMPAELIDAVTYHHDPEYVTGEHVVYANLIFSVNKLLVTKDIGDEFMQLPIPPKILQNLGLTLAELQQLFLEFWDNRAALDGVLNTLLGKK